MKLTIGQKILFGYGLAMLLMVITGFAEYRSGERLLEASGWVQHTFIVIGNAEDIRADLLPFENVGRGYIVTGDVKFLEPLDGIRTHLAQSRKVLRTLTADNPDQQRRLDVLDPVIDRGLADLTLISNVRQEKGLAAAQMALEQGNSQERLAEIRTLLTAMEDQERTLLTERKRNAQSGAQSSNQTILYGTLVGLALAAFIGIMIYRCITRPLGEFQQFVTSIGEGDLTQRSAPEGSDELGKLGRGLNQMVTRLRTMATQTRAATENLNTATMEILASAREQSAITGEQVAAYQETNATMQQLSQSGQFTSKPRRWPRTSWP